MLKAGCAALSRPTGLKIGMTIINPNQIKFDLEDKI
jgi:hypothetical protein